PRAGGVHPNTAVDIQLLMRWSPLQTCAPVGVPLKFQCEAECDRAFGLGSFPLTIDPRLLYQGWRPKRWETPFSDVKSLVVVSLTDSDTLQVVVEAARTMPRRRWRIDFGRVPGYLNLMEEFRLELWGQINPGEVKLGWALIIPDSPWIEKLCEREPLLHIHHPTLTHYQIGSEDDVIDVLGPSTPAIQEIEPAAENESLPEKSRRLFYPDGRAEIEGLAERIRNRTPTGP
ncbi:MAG: hypothetical protein LC667_18215, partial [Thioalkalivibrio sp.]|nr:hypothetical protein [Thioalkalivibrio sp.]